MLESVHDLDLLPEGSAILDRTRHLYQKWYSLWYLPGISSGAKSEEIPLPAQIVKI